jgi:hypothetical protein
MKMATMAAKSNKVSFHQAELGFDIDPTSRPMAFKFGVQNVQLPEAIDEPRIVGRSGRIMNRRIESPKQLFESVVVAFAVTARKVGVTTRRGTE